MSTRLHIVVSEGLVGRVDRVRGDVPRSVWIRRAVERALEQPLSNVDRSRELAAESPAPAEQPEMITTPEVVRRYEATMAREFRPYPKGGKR